MKRLTAALLITLLMSGCVFPPPDGYGYPPYGKQQSQTVGEQGYWSSYGLIIALGAGLLVGLLNDEDREAVGM